MLNLIEAAGGMLILSAVHVGPFAFLAGLALTVYARRALAVIEAEELSNAGVI